jgi:hypothetical protein
LASRRAANAEEKNKGKIPRAGRTREEIIPWMRRMRKAGGKVRIERARRVCGVDFVKIVKFRREPAIIAD